MLVSPRTYHQARAELSGKKELGTFGPVQSLAWHIPAEVAQISNKMLLIHQTGSVKIGEVVRYAIPPAITAQSSR